MSVYSFLKSWIIWKHEGKSVFLHIANHLEPDISICILTSFRNCSRQSSSAKSHCILCYLIIVSINSDSCQNPFMQFWHFLAPLPLFFSVLYVAMTKYLYHNSAKQDLVVFSVVQMQKQRWYLPQRASRRIKIVYNRWF